MLLPSGNPFKCHQEVLSLQPVIPPKRFDIFPPDWGMIRSRCVQIVLYRRPSLSWTRSTTSVPSKASLSLLFICSTTTTTRVLWIYLVGRAVLLYIVGQQSAPLPTADCFAFYLWCLFLCLIFLCSSTIYNNNCFLQLPTQQQLLLVRFAPTAIIAASVSRSSYITASRGGFVMRRGRREQF